MLIIASKPNMGDCRVVQQNRVYNFSLRELRLTQCEVIRNQTVTLVQ